mmetsp:Transcript_12322/g.23895  ORF Transcript_12322/g.23895 Transcript_12322/m.23895 type:complete len:169 (-) Transcript_12322:1559-2065(-)
MQANCIEKPRQMEATGFNFKERTNQMACSNSPHFPHRFTQTPSSPSPGSPSLEAAQGDGRENSHKQSLSAVCCPHNKRLCSLTHTEAGGTFVVWMGSAKQQRTRTRCNATDNEAGGQQKLSLCFTACASTGPPGSLPLSLQRLATTQKMHALALNTEHTTLHCDKGIK